MKRARIYQTGDVYIEEDGTSMVPFNQTPVNNIDITDATDLEVQSIKLHSKNPTALAALQATLAKRKENKNK